jgi:esterase/lipase superfamily enzyme
MFAVLLAATSMFTVSDRDNVWDYNTISQKTHFASVDEAGVTTILKDSQVKQALSSVKGQKILLLVHGLDTTQPISYYFDIQANINNSGKEAHYDQVIGYLWPCFDKTYYYYYAKENIKNISSRFRSFLQKIKHAGASSIDVVAHSLGNRLVLESLDFAKDPKAPNLIHRFFSVAPAVNDTSIDKGGHFYQASLNCDQMFVFYSTRDSVLKWFYPIAEWRQALGYEGDSYPRELSAHVQMVDCSPVIDTHDAYLFNLSVFNYLQHACGDPKFSPAHVQDVVINSDGTFQITRTRDPAPVPVLAPAPAMIAGSN